MQHIYIYCSAANKSDLSPGIRHCQFLWPKDTWQEFPPSTADGTVTPMDLPTLPVIVLPKAGFSRADLFPDPA